jgi:gamma-glutamylcyclotransferase (GGCT)/AIG2-like uncharacterized protein YtfP
MSSVAPTEKLFSYGTLQLDSVQLATLGRKLEGRQDAVVGYQLITIVIANPNFVQQSGTAHHRNIQFTGATTDLVEGTVLEVTNEELERADEYERGADYKRVLVRLRSGVEAWVYLHIPE